MPIWISAGAARRLAARASVSGGQRSRTEFFVDLSGVCVEPVPRWFACKRDRDLPSLLIEVLTQCRSCELCAWSYRTERKEWAAVELGTAARSWWITLTYGPRARQMFMLAGSGRSDEDRWKLWSRSARKDFRAWAKRVREGRRPRLRFRFAAVVEKHKDGFPHLHALLHEYEGEPIRKHYMEAKWKLGNITKIKLVEQEEDNAEVASYLCKYLTKDASTWFASRLYGRCQPQAGALSALVSGSVERGECNDLV